jgi:hypothetical protein
VTVQVGLLYTLLKPFRGDVEVWLRESDGYSCIRVKDVRAGQYGGQPAVIIDGYSHDNAGTVDKS